MRKILATLLLAMAVLACSPAGSRQLFTQPNAESSRSNLNQRDPTQTVVVKALKANLRDKPSRAGAVIAKVNKGDSLRALDSMPAGAWYRVREPVQDIEGWIHGNLITSPTVTTVAAPVRPPPLTATPTRGERSYVNVDGERVRSPVFSDSRPAGASARCRDGSYSFSRNRRGTCSWHGGVAVWF